MTTEPIVVGYDDSPESRKTLEWALRTAQGRHAQVLLVRAARTFPLIVQNRGNNIPPPHEKVIEAGRATLDAGVLLAASTAPEVTVTTLLLKDSPAAELLSALEKAAMVVVGSRGTGGFGLLVVGSTCLKLANHAPCPVVVVPAQATHPEPGPETGRVVVGIDNSEPASSDLLTFAFEEAAWRRTGLTVLHAWQEQRYGIPGKSGSSPQLAHCDEVHAERRRLAERIGGWQEKYPYVEVSHVVLWQSPAAALLAASAGAELVVVGSRPRVGRHSLLLGSVSQELLHDAQCPVAVVGGRSTEIGDTVRLLDLSGSPGRLAGAGATRPDRGVSR